MQQQVMLLEQENKLLQNKEGEREALMGLELSDGQPLNEHMVQLKLKYEKCKRDLEARITLLKNTEQENISSINGLKLDNNKLTENIEQLTTKIDRTKKKMNEDDLGFRERKDEIDNEIERCKKTNKQAFTDLMDARSDINDNLNKKREIERKIEDENKKFKMIEEELVKKITDLNKKIAEAKQVKKSLELDKKENTSIQNLTNYQRELSNKVGDLKSDSDNQINAVSKTQNQITNFLSTMMDH